MKFKELYTAVFKQRGGGGSGSRITQKYLSTAYKVDTKFKLEI